MTKITKISPTLLLLFLCFLFLVFLSHGVLSQSLQEQEKTVLLKLKQHWGNLSFMSEWTPSNNSYCSWPGIICTSNSVTMLSLYAVMVQRPVLDFICDLKNLTTIDLGLNNIPGEFPRALLNCSKLEALDLSENFFVGRLPNDIDKMAKLQSLVLEGNKFTGDISPAIGKMKELKVLSLGYNFFNGSLPPEIGNLSSLEDLRLADNELLVPSSLPSNYTQLRKLKKLWVFNSNLIGEIPQSIGDLEALEWLDLSNNDLHRKIPDGLFTLKNLSIVMLFKNRLSGEVPQVVEALNLTVIDLSENRLTGRIPEDFGKLTNMSSLALFSNQLSGTIPDGIGRLPSLVDCNLWDNNLSGDVPHSLWTSITLNSLMLNNNSFTGVLPEKLALNLRVVDISYNRFSGNAPGGIWTLPHLYFLKLNKNKFTGSLPEQLGRNLSVLDISNNRFSGRIPTAVSSLRNLSVFRASSNLLIGTIPLGLFALPSLTELFLNENQLTGDLPSDILSCDFLHTLNLSQNQLTGQVWELDLLPLLANLDLSKNQFSGQIPPQLGLSELDFLNLSSNKFTGTIPRKFEKAAYSNSFLNNPGLCGSNKVLNVKPCNLKSQDLRKLSTQHLAFIILASIVVLLLALSFIFFIIIRRCRGKHEVILQWKLTTFQRINFTESNILPGLTDHNLIGSGGSGIVYRIPINDQDDIVAVKRIWNNGKVEQRLEQEFLSEVKILSLIQHTNIVRLLCCISSECSKLLVYEYLENQSLDRWLHNKSRQIMVPAPHSTNQNQIMLDWPKRLKIAVGAAQGLYYMHHDCLPPVIHRDIKSSNILLDSNFNPKIADFGLAKLLAKQGELATMSAVAGTFGYLAPEYARTTRVNEKIDVYSFGVVLLELATGREAKDGDEYTSLAQWAWRHLQENKPIEEALDGDIKEQSNADEMSCVFKLGIICTGTLPSTRPSMKDVLTVLLRCSHKNLS